MVDPEQIKKWMQQAIGQLPEKRRMVYELSRVHGLTYREIAKVMDISIKTVETQMARSLKHLRNRLREYLKK
jgi:RNA polymerase sigma-70 factor (ECF subfamily)